MGFRDHVIQYIIIQWIGGIGIICSIGTDHVFKILK